MKLIFNLIGIWFFLLSDSPLFFVVFDHFVLTQMKTTQKCNKRFFFVLIGKETYEMGPNQKSFINDLENNNWTILQNLIILWVKSTKEKTN